MENSDIFHLKLDVNHKMCSEFRNYNQSLNKFYNFGKEICGNDHGRHAHEMTTLLKGRCFC